MIKSNVVFNDNGKSPKNARKRLAEVRVFAWDDVQKEWEVGLEMLRGGERIRQVRVSNLIWKRQKLLKYKVNLILKI